MLRLLIQQFGKICSRILCLLFSAVILCSCTSLLEEGRGDWSINLFDGYVITRVNGHCQVIAYKENPDDSNSKDVIPLFYVKAYQLHEPYIFLQGIETQGEYADEEELSQNELCYFVVDTTSENYFGPFDTVAQMEECCSALGIQINLTEKWIIAEKTRY